MAVPEVLYNKGELYNLGVARGTLSEEERYKINEHIVQTLIMLTQLPFPKHLRNVPEIAAGHHEKMDGTGYPRRLTRDEMSPVARMMAIADIFEALTAVDRPYKKGKTLSEAIRIMSFMKKDQHIDPELFDLFLRSGVYREYAERFMKPEQIDSGQRRCLPRQSDRRGLTPAALGRPVNPVEQCGCRLFVALANRDLDTQAAQLQRADRIADSRCSRRNAANLTFRDQQAGAVLGDRVAECREHGAPELARRTAHQPHPAPAPGKRPLSHRQSAARRPAYRLP